MKKITFKQIVIIDGEEHCLSTTDYSQTIYQEEQEFEEMSENEIIEEIRQYENC